MFRNACELGCLQFSRQLGLAENSAYATIESAMSRSVELSVPTWTENARRTPMPGDSQAANPRDGDQHVQVVSACKGIDDCSATRRYSAYIPPWPFKALGEVGDARVELYCASQRFDNGNLVRLIRDIESCDSGVISSTWICAIVQENSNSCGVTKKGGFM